MRSRIPCGIS
ncbi:unnamed protein product [Gulo gulo]|uniref:Uncharacterized protein n=1 Tax=Gulo gulo TaxID=48420 RepID=A0A9X9Q1E8_GULGU|nr:unnamed protein product [Gulo gulo]